MSKLRAIIGYTLAALAVPLVLAVFMGQSFWMKELVAATGVKVSPWLTGGDVIRTISHDEYQISIHEQVFQGLLSEKKEGLVQVDWKPAKNLPDRIDEDIDYDGDGKNDFHIALDTKSNQAYVQSLQTGVIGLEKSYVLKDGQAVRVRIKNPRK
ncbi:MAG TPA: hypothetical protein VN426_12150 [Syntrophomonadaceae bacterium]|nr:hypothetical protein [Syntrophomonadaceae bacterium]